MPERISARVLGGSMKRRGSCGVRVNRMTTSSCGTRLRGGLEEGEDLRTAALREINEELGLQLEELAGPVHEGQCPHTFTGTSIEAHEWFFLSHVQASAITDVAETGEGARYFEGWRWWSL